MKNLSSENKKFKKTPDNSVVWGLIVCFYPDVDVLSNLVRSLSDQVSVILILNNGGIDNSLRNILLNFENVIFHDFECNKGIAAALNEGFLQAVARNADFVVTFDQDSCPESEHVAGLMKQWVALSSIDDVKINKKKVGAIGPSFYDARNGHFEYPFYRANGFRVVKQYSTNGVNFIQADALITSGMLVPTTMWSSGLKFNELLFIDFVDTEWCFRASKFGYINYGCFDVKMKHELSEAAPVIFLGLIILKYSPIRRYYHFRNCIYLIFQSYVPLAFKFRLIAGLLLRFFTAPFVDEKPLSSIKNIFFGVFDALRGRYGYKVIPTASVAPVVKSLE